MNLLRSDLNRNRGNPKGVLVAILFRSCGFLYFNKKNPFFFLLGLTLIPFYRLFVEGLLSVGLPLSLCAEGGLVIFHGQGLVLNGRTKIGVNVTLRQNTTIGSKLMNCDGPAPVLGDNVNVGANSVILGDILVGNGSIVGAGSVVVKDVPPGVVVAGNPAQIIRRISPPVTY